MRTFNEREKIMTTKAIEKTRNVFVSASEKFATVALEAETKLKVENLSDEEKKALKDTASENRTHEKYCMIIAKQSDEIIAILNAQKVDAQALALSSRELKKRAVFMLQALVSQRKVDDRAFDSVLLRLAAKREASLTVDQIQREMQHKTATQANYFKTFCEFFNFATYSKSEKRVTFNYDAYFLSELVKVYS